MAGAKEIVLGFQKALGGGDWDVARQFLSNRLSFVGPFESLDRPEPVLDALRRLHPIIERIEPKKMFVDGDDVCMLYDMVTKTPAGTAFICEWYRVKGDKIASIRVVFDARPFAPLFGK